MREITIPLKVETIIAKSYGNNIQTSGAVNILQNQVDFKNKDIIIIEDIVDTGLTMKKLLEHLKKERSSFYRDMHIAL